MKSPLAYVEGDLFARLEALRAFGAEATKPPHVTFVVPHVCNDQGGWGAGFVVPLGRKFPPAMHAYRAWFRGDATEFGIAYLADAHHTKLGISQWVPVETPINSPDPKVVVVNMVAQHGYGPGRVVRYNVLAACMDQVALQAKNTCANPEIHAPMFGAGLGGGDWNIIEKLIEDCWLERGLRTTIYYLPGTLPGNWSPPPTETAHVT